MINDRIQGTDGIRRPIILDDDPLAAGLSPLEIFCQLDRLSPRFFGLYAYAFGRWLQQKGKLITTNSILVGSDPRDPEGIFLHEVLDALKNSGVNVINLGIVPTPALPLLVSYWDATAGIMLTASHNPPEHHGIKLFLPGDLKAYPADDRELTTEVFHWGTSSQLPVLPGGNISDRSEEARRVFLDFSTDRKNTWLDETLSTERVILVVDPAFGSLSGLAMDVLMKIGFASVIEVNLASQAPVNYHSGVADLEGKERITRDEVTKTGGIFNDYRALHELLTIANTNLRELVSGEKILLGLIFDADGDRFFCLPYLPHLDELAVLSGDETAILQAAYLAHHHTGHSWHSLYVNTVESDLEAARHAQSLGFVPQLTAVGDKWVLRLAQLARTERAFQFCRVYSVDTLKLVELERDFIALKTDPDTSALTQEKFWSVCTSLIPNEILPSFWEYIINTGEIGYSVGSEETGHNITVGVFAKTDGAPFTVLAGNGLKSATNTIAAILELLGEGIADEAFWSRVTRPFTQGFKENHYIYWVGKELFEPNAGFRTDLEVQVLRLLKELFPELDASLQPFSEEPTMAYYKASRDGGQVLACFVRPSGTENKAGIYLRGPMAYSKRLATLGEQLYVWLWGTIRQANCPEAVRQTRLLRELTLHTLQLEEAMKLLDSWGAAHPKEEIFIMEFKQHLIETKGEKLNLTNLGSAVNHIG